MDIHFEDKSGRSCVVWFGDEDYTPSEKSLREVREVFPDAILGPSMSLNEIDIDDLFFVANWNCYPLRSQS